ncbi:tubulin domain-containing protein [Vararia minispora EC-137]|uniref:Tubulin domain-containing protein n=1 Tax=Vararia minispora EC-137 TaxID=1314806 RepID=A0ACB8QSP8_9AGAM|nr:tubulin domain-containing protein [Vararia minispora EC-137]
MTYPFERDFLEQVLLIDRKANFGALCRSNVFYDDFGEDRERTAALWNGTVDEVHQDEIARSTYQDELDEEIDEDPDPTGKAQPSDLPAPVLRSSGVRYWSDYNRVYYHPRSVHKLPDILAFEGADEDWDVGKVTYEKYDLEYSFVDDSFRHFIEESDSCQGVGVTADASFGSFSTSLLAAIHDENPKLTSLFFPILADVVPTVETSDNLRAVRKILNDARRLLVLEELSSLSVPLDNPTTWQAGTWSEGLDIMFSSPFEVSAVLSAHIETATLPLRLKGSTPLLDFCSQLNGCGSAPFAEMSGALPLESIDSLDLRMHNFTWALQGNNAAVKDAHTGAVFRREVLRGLDNSVRPASGHMRAAQAMTASLTASIVAPLPYPLPTSYPHFFRSPLLNDRSRRTPRGILSKRCSAPLASALGLHSDGLPVLFERYASFVDSCVREKVRWEMVGMESDDARDLAARLWTIYDNLGAERSQPEDDGFDVDEEA